jgi:DNA polymerase-1
VELSGEPTCLENRGLPGDVKPANAGLGELLLDKPTLILVDGSGYIFRGYFAIRSMTSPEGVPVNAVFGYSSMILAMLADFEPEQIIVAFDTKGPGFRHDIYADYKANRPPAPEDLIPQFALIRDVTDAFGLHRIEAAGWEADDLIATAATQAVANGQDVIVISGDKDLMQLVRPGVRMLDPMKNKWIGEDEVREKFGCRPDQVVEIQALAGDSSDNIPGVHGIGVKTAALLLEEYGTLEGILMAAHAVDENGKPLIKQNKRRERLQEQADMARISLQLVTLREDAPLVFDSEAFSWNGLDPAVVVPMFDAFGFRRLQRHRLLTKARAERAQVEVESGGLDRSNYRLITDAKELLKVCNSIRSAGAFAWDTETTGLDPAKDHMVGLSLAWGPGEAVYVPFDHVDALGSRRSDQLQWVMVRSLVGRLLGDSDLQQYAQNWKFDARMMAAAGLNPLAPSGDPMIAAYLLDPVARNFGLDELARQRLGHDMIPYDAVAKGLAHFGHVDLQDACNYAAEDADATLRLALQMAPEIAAEGLERLYRDVELPLSRVLCIMEETGISLDLDVLSDLSAELAGRLISAESKAHELAGEVFNLASPKQVAAVLFEKLELPVLKKTKSGPSTDASVLEKLAEKGHELPKVLLGWRHDAKLRSTYAEVLPKAIGNDGRLHTRYLQTRTATGRLASREPNLQNIPIRTADGRRVRQAFKARPGYLLISADYSQVELRVLAHMSRDPILTEAFRNGEDIHRRTASELFDVPPLLVTPEMRRDAKAINFGIVYGMGAFRLATELGIPRAQAQEYLETFHERYAGVRRFHEECVKQAHSENRAMTLYGRRRPIPEMRSSSQRDVAQGERIAINTPVQGSAADLLKMAMVALQKDLEQQHPEARMLLTVHDELVLEAPIDQAAAVARTVRAAMEGAAELSVPLVVDVGQGAHWGDAH